MLFSKSLNRAFLYRNAPDKVFEHFSRSLYLYQKGTLVKPERLFIFPSALCNDSCLFCSDGLNAQDYARMDFLQYNKDAEFFSNIVYIDRLIKDVINLKIRDIHLFGGGEPFFYKENMFYFLEQIKKADVFVRIITNGNNLEERDIRHIVKNKLVSQLNISFNSDSEETAAKIYRSSSRHSHAVALLRQVVYYKKLFSVEYPQIDIMFIAMKVNYDKILEIIRLLSNLKINFFMFQSLRCYEHKQKVLALSLSEKNELAQAIPSIQKELNMHTIQSNLHVWKSELGLSAEEHAPVTISSLLELVNSNSLVLKCYMPLSTLSICYNGKIPLCQNIYHRLYEQNYFKIKSLKDFIKSKEYTYFVSHFIDGALPAVCSECAFCTFGELEDIKNRFIFFSQENINA